MDIRKPLQSALDAAGREEFAQQAFGDAADKVAFIEAVLRFFSYHGRSLQGVAKKRFGGESEVHLRWLLDTVLEAEPAALVTMSDYYILNALLYCRDALADYRAEEIDRRLDHYRAALLNHREHSTPTNDALLNVDQWQSEAAQSKGICLICPSPYSLYSLVLFELALRLNIPIKSVVIRSFSLQRFKSEFKRDGFRLLKKIYRKLLLKADENADETDLSLKKLSCALPVAFSNIRDYAKKHAVPVYTLSSFNDFDGSQEHGEAAFFAGGGMIPPSLLDCFQHGVINIHMGILPQYRGMDVVESPIMESQLNEVGLSAHFMVEGLDLGPIISRHFISTAPYKSLGELRNEVGFFMPLRMIDAYLGFLSGRYPLEYQQAADGRQYFYVHPSIKGLIDGVLSNNRQPKGAAEPSFEQMVAQLDF